MSNYSDSKDSEKSNTVQVVNPIVMSDFPYISVGFAPRTVCLNIHDNAERVGRRGAKIKHFLIFIYRIVNIYCTKWA